MKQISLRFFSVLLVLIMLFGMIPLSAKAEGAPASEGLRFVDNTKELQTLFVDYGNTVTLETPAIMGATGTVSYTWYKNKNYYLGTTETPFYTPTSLHQNTEFSCEISDDITTIVSQFKVLINGKMYFTGREAVSTYEDSLAADYGDCVTLIVPTIENAEGPLTYQWSINHDIIEGATSSSYTTERVASSSSYYKCLVSDGKTELIYSVQLQQKGGMKFVDSFSSLSPNVNYGETITMEAFEVAGAAGDLTYMWRKDGCVLEGTTTPTYTTTVTSPAYYECSISDGLSSITCQFMVSLKDAMSFTGGRQQETLTVNYASSATLIVPEIQSAKGGLSYQWYKYTNQNYGENFILSTATKASYTVEKVVEASMYSCEISDGSTTLTYFIIINVDNQLGFEEEKEDSKVAKRYISVNYGDSFTINVPSIKGTPANPLSYQWFKNNAPFSSVPMENNTYISVVAQENTVYSCEISDGLTSLSFHTYVTVENAMSFIAGTDTPTNYYVSLGQSVNLTVPEIINAANPLSYQWYDNSSGATIELEGATASSYLTTPILSVDTHVYYCVITDGFTSLVYRVFVTAKRGMFFSYGTSSTSYDSVNFGDTLSLEVPEIFGATGSVSYQWYQKKMSSIEPSFSIDGAIQPTYIVNHIIDDMIYFCEITDGATTLVYSRGFYVSKHPSFVNDIDTKTISAPYASALTIEAFDLKYGQIDAYQWYKNDTLINDATEKTYIIPRLLAPAEYRCEITVGDFHVSCYIVVKIEGSSYEIVYSNGRVNQTAFVNESYQFRMVQKENEIILSDINCDWEIFEGDVHGTITENGVFTALKSGGYVIVRATLKDGSGLSVDKCIYICEKYTPTSNTSTLRVQNLFVHGTEYRNYIFLNESLGVSFAIFYPNAIHDTSWDIINETGSATFSPTGEIVGTKLGSFSLRIVGNNGEYSERRFYVVDGIPAQKISIDYEKDTILLGEATSLSTTIFPDNAVDKVLSWEVVDKTGSAAITHEGVITGTGLGSVTVRASSTDIYGAYVEKTLYVVASENVPVEKITIQYTYGPGNTLSPNYPIDYNSTIDQKIQLESIITPFYATNINVVWESSNENVAVVDSTGLVTIQGMGECNIIVKTQDGYLQDTKSLVVKDRSMPYITSLFNVTPDFASGQPGKIRVSWGPSRDLASGIDHHIIGYKISSSSKNTNWIYVKVNGNAGSYTFYNMPDQATYTFSLTVVDNAGNKNGPKLHSDITIRDYTAPLLIDFSIDVDSWTSNSSPTVSWSVVEDSPCILQYKIVHAEKTFDWTTHFSSKTGGSLQFDFRDVKKYPDGEYTIYAHIVDNNGNISNEKTVKYFKNTIFTATFENTNRVSGSYTVDEKFILYYKTPASGYKFAYWETVGLPEAKYYSESLIFTMPANNIDIKPVYAPVRKVTVVGGLASKTSCIAGDLITITANTVSAGPPFKHWEVFGLENNTYATEIFSFIMPDNNVQVRAVYESFHSVIISGGEGSGSHYMGNTVTATAHKADIGTRFKHWNAIGLPQKTYTASTLTFTMPNNAVTLTAVYESISDTTAPTASWMLPARDAKVQGKFIAQVGGVRDDLSGVKAVQVVVYNKADMNPKAYWYNARNTANGVWDATIEIERDLGKRYGTYGIRFIGYDNAGNNQVMLEQTVVYMK